MTSTIAASRRVRSERTAELFAATLDATTEELTVLVEQLVLLNQGVAHAVASRYRGRGISTEDLEQTADEGLVKAVRRFDPRLGNDFLSYAVPTIRGEVQRHFRDRGWMVRPPRRIQELQARINAMTDVLSHELSRAPSHAELVAALGITDEAYAAAVSAFGCFHPRSLDQPVTESSSTSLGDLLVAEQEDEVSARLQLSPLLRRLPERDRRILFMRFYEERTQAEIGAEIGVTQMQVSRVLDRILRRLRTDLGES